MKKHVYNSLTDFYNDIVNVVKAHLFEKRKSESRKEFMGLPLTEIEKYKFSYPIGVKEISHFKKVEVQKDLNIKVYNDFDGYDINVDRMLDGLDYIIDNKKIRKLPKSIDIYINISESSHVHYKQMLLKTYAATSIIDHLETLGVRCAVYATACIETRMSNNHKGERVLIEICVKNPNESLNIGSISTAISPWMLRHWMCLFLAGRVKGIGPTIGSPERLPRYELNGIVIDTEQCLNKSDADSFIESVKI